MSRDLFSALGHLVPLICVPALNPTAGNHANLVLEVWCYNREDRKSAQVTPIRIIYRGI